MKAMSAPSSIFLCTFGAILMVVADVAWPSPDVRPPPLVWNCSGPNWIRSPAFTDDLLIGRVESSCQLSGVPEGGIKKLFDFIKADVPSSGRYQMHAPPTGTSLEGVPGFRFDVTDTIDEEGTTISIRQNMFLGLALGKKFLYETESVDITASGRASALEKVIFRTVLTNSVAHFENEIHLRRPWYAFPPILFRAVGKTIAQDKFVKARDKLIEYFAPHL